MAMYSWEFADYKNNAPDVEDDKMAGTIYACNDVNE
jgi:hypothetical protein